MRDQIISTEKVSHGILALAALAIAALTVVFSASGNTLLSGLSDIDRDLPVSSVGQFKDIANVFSLVSELSVGLESLSAADTSLNRGKVEFTVGKAKVAAAVVLRDFEGAPPADLATILREIELVSEDLSEILGRGDAAERVDIRILQRRVEYVSAELRDYVIRINNSTLVVLGKSKSSLGQVRASVTRLILIAVAWAAMVCVLFLYQRRILSRLEESRKEALRNSDAKGEFLSNMSHEIRTPMNSIIGLSYLALKTELTPTQRGYLTRIQGASRHLLGVINDILDFSKIESGKLALERIPFSLRKVLDDVANLIGEKASQKNLELIIDMPRDIPETLVGDPLRLSQILINLANNAIKFTEKGEVSVIVRATRPGDDSVILRFEVRDTGIGMSAEQQSGLFESFRQGDSSTTRKFGGTGLGLAISKRLSSLMNGDIGCESALGAGSVFWFTASFSLSSDLSRGIPELLTLGRLRALVVDDNAHAREVMSDMIRAYRVSVDAVESGEAALAALARAESDKSPYDIAFLDWQMPGMDGIETATRIIAESARKPPAIVMVTAYGREDVMERAKALGIDTIILKPVSPSMLLDTLMHAVAGSRPEPVARANAPSLPESGTRNRCRVLLVEDNAENQDVAREILSSVGCDVDIAGNGSEALASLRERTYKIVFMDIQMPVMDGFDATAEIRRNPAWNDIPVVGMTANARKEDVDRGLSLGMNDYVTKPIEPERLFEVVRRFCGADSAICVDGPCVAAPDRSSYDIANVSTDEGLRRAMGNESVYSDLLRRFASGQRDAVRRIGTAMGAGKKTEAIRIAHTLKGVSANLGAKGVCMLASELETALSGGVSASDRGPLETRLAEELEAVCGAIDAHFENAANSSETEDVASERDSGAGEFDVATLNELIRLIESSDAGALDELNRKRDAFCALMGKDAFVSLESALRSYDFDVASRIARGGKI